MSVGSRQKFCKFDNRTFAKNLWKKFAPLCQKLPIEFKVRESEQSPHSDLSWLKHGINTISLQKSSIPPENESCYERYALVHHYTRFSHIRRLFLTIFRGKITKFRQIFIFMVSAKAQIWNFYKGSPLCKRPIFEKSHLVRPRAPSVYGIVLTGKVSQKVVSLTPRARFSAISWFFRYFCKKLPKNDQNLAVFSYFRQKWLFLIIFQN